MLQVLFPTNHNNKMAETQTHDILPTLALFTLGPQIGGYWLGISCVCYCSASVNSLRDNCCWSAGRSVGVMRACVDRWKGKETWLQRSVWELGVRE
jgi:hypothetical protein